MSDLFSIQSGSPAPMKALKPAAWRAPDMPREQPCRACGGAAPCGMDGVFYCTVHAPDSYWPAGRGA